MTSSITNNFITFPGVGGDPNNDDLELFCDMDIDPSAAPSAATAGETDAMRMPSEPGGATMMDDDLDSQHYTTSTRQAAPNGDGVSFDQPQYYHTTVASAAMTAAAAANAANAARRHTVGPGDVAYGQSSLGHPPINFKFGDGLAQPVTMAADAATAAHQLLPTNLPMLQNQPLMNFGVKNHHLLKPPTVMENSKWI